ncbi:uncharacterized protein LOC114520077 [Dendronephthya gigantea]|uniref:uncharacterized protein LOC114520077 n=1 Tax=Dendronephthya gigantea TaxID=151771 RepID=UPI001069DDCA|nr:uncharacterized protein LOC114520077 [Dendronephthya gigantea]
MGTNLGQEREDLAKAKRDLLMRFIKDQEQLQTRQVASISSNNDETFDILDGLTTAEDNTNIKGGIRPKKLTHKRNEQSKADEKQNIPRSQTCIPNFRVHQREHSFAELKEEKLHSRLKSGKKLQDRTNPIERPASEASLRRLRSAPSFSGRQSRTVLRSGDIEVKARKVPSLSIVVPNQAGDVDKKTKQRSSLTCAQVRSRGAVGISAVDVELFDKRAVPTLPYAMFHLPPITSETAPSPPST